MDDLSPLIEDWPVGAAAIGVTDVSATLGTGGDDQWVQPIASISKLIVGWSCLIAIEEGSMTLADEAGPPGATVEHLFSHASGLAFDSRARLATPGRRRIYSNTGIEELAAHLERSTDMSFAEYARVGVVEPLGLSNTSLIGSPAHGFTSSVGDLLVLAREFLAPTLIHEESFRAATTVHFPTLPGVLPGVGSFDPNPWGLGFEIKGDKSPHWTGTKNGPDTYGHFGGSGSFLWVDPVAGLAAVSLASREFDRWALDVWPSASDAVIERYS